MTDDQLEEILELWKAGRFYQAGTHASELITALRSAWVTTARLKDHAAYLNLERAEAQALLAALKQEHQPADALRSQLLAEMEAHAETKAELAEAVRVGDERLATLWDEKKAELASIGIINDHVRAEFVSEIRRLKSEVNTLNDELAASNATIDMLYERSGRFAAQADKYEQELKAAKEEIIRLRRHLGEIP